MADTNTVSTLTAPLAGLAGVLIGAWITTVRDERKRQIEWRAKQLSEFCAPLWAIRSEILALSQYRANVDNAMTSGSQTAITGVEAIEGLHPDSKRERVDNIVRMYSSDLEYNQKQLRKVILPAYRQMQELFRDRLQFCDPETAEFFPALVGFNETWRRQDETEDAG